MNFTAIYIVSEIDNIVFKLIRKGFCPCFHIVKFAASIEDVKFHHRKRGEGCLRKVFNTLNIQSFVVILATVWLLIEVALLQCKQQSGEMLRQDYSDCYVNYHYYIGDGICHGGEYNTVECRLDGGDCIEYNF